MTAGPSTDIQAFPIPPSFVDIFLNKSAKLTCLVTDLATYDTLNISWASQSGEPLETNTKLSESHSNGTFSAIGQANVCVADWESGKEFVCTVAHRDLPSPQKKIISKPRGMNSPFPSPQSQGSSSISGGWQVPFYPCPHHCLCLQRWSSNPLLCTCCRQPVNN